MANPLDLLFRPDDRDPLHLVFGDEGGSGAPQYTIGAAGVITGVRGFVRIHAVYRAQAAGRISGVRGTVAVAYDANVQRPSIAWRRALQQQATPQLSGVRAGWQNADRLSTARRQVVQVAQPQLAAVRPAWQRTLPLASTARVVAELGQPIGVSARLGFQRTLVLSRTVREVAQPGAPVALAVRAGFQQTLHRWASAREHLQQGRPLLSQAQVSLQQGVPLLPGWRVRFQTGRNPPPGASPRLGPGRDPWCYTPALPIELVFKPDARAPLDLLFECDRHTGPGPQPGATVVVPIRRVYMTVNSITLHRVDGMVPIPADGFDMSLDVDSWTWAWSATMPAASLPLIQPEVGGDPVEILATVNGVPYRLAAEGFTRDRQFASDRISVKGRGRAALLDAPYAPVLNHGNTAARTAQQLMADVLTLNGVGIGWDVDWQLTDWLVPGGVWTHQGAYMAALTDIAEAAGAYLQPHDTAATVRVLPRYPAPPWEWSSLTPDFELPSAVVSVEGTEWLRRPDYDRVYVAGVNVGVRGRVTRAGTAGALVAPMVTHPLITHADAARQRGIAELSNTGTQVHISLRLPVLADTGVIKPGALVRYVDEGTAHLGLVRSTQVQWSRPILRQVLTLETHPETIP